MESSRTKTATKFRRSAMKELMIAESVENDDSVGARHHRALAEHFTREADALLVPAAVPQLAHGEVLPMRAPDGQNWIRDTLASPNQLALDASIQRTDLLLQDSTDVLAIAVDAAESVGAKNSLEKMLTHQMALTHKAVFTIMDKAMQKANGHEVTQADSVELARLSNTAARLMVVYQQGLLTLQRLRTGGNQTMTVQHVHVERGAQALIGNVQTSDRKLAGPDEEER